MDIIIPVWKKETDDGRQFMSLSLPGGFTLPPGEWSGTIWPVHPDQAGGNRPTHNLKLRPYLNPKKGEEKRQERGQRASGDGQSDPADTSGAGSGASGIPF